MAEKHSLALLPRALIEEGFEPTTYTVCHRAAMNGTIPVSRGSNGRWFWSPEDLPVIAESLGLGHAVAA